MARVEYTGVPEAEPQLQAPEDYQHEEASPASFGAQVGQGLEQAGSGAFKLVQFYGQVAADNATNNFLDQRAKILYGDPSMGPAVGPDGKPVVGPDGAPAYNGGFFGLRGADALKAAPDVQSKMDEIITEEREGLQTPAARQQYDVDTRRYRAQTMADIGQHSDQQYKVWATDTNNTSAQLALSQVARTAADPDASALAGQGVRKAYVRNAQLNGEDAAGAILKADQDVAMARVHALIVNDPITAQKVFDQSAGVLSSRPDYDVLARQVKEATINAQMAPAIDTAVNDAFAQAQREAVSVAANARPPSAPISAPGVASSGQKPGEPAKVLPPVNLGHFMGGEFGDKEPTQGSGAGPTPSAQPDSFNAQQYLRVINAHEGTARNPASSAEGFGQFLGRVDENGRGSGTWFSVMRGDPQFASLIAGKTDQQILDLRKDPNVAQAATLALARTNGRILEGAGIPATETNVGLAHGFGPGGAEQIIRAAAQNPGTPMSAVFSPEVVSGNRLQSKTVGDVLSDYSRRFGGSYVGGSGAGNAYPPGAYPSVTDALRANEGNILDKAQADAERLFPNYPDAQQRYVDGVDRRIQQKISQQDQQYTVDTHIVQAAIVAGHITSEDQLNSASPDVQRAWQSVQINNPYGAMSIERMFDANARGKAAGYGSEFKDYLDRALAPASNPDRITNPSQLWDFVGDGEDAPLTNAGANEISGILSSRGTPEGEAFASQAKTFIDNMHAQLTYTNKGTGIIDQKGEQMFSRFMIQALPVLERAYKDGDLNKVLNPNSADYIGNLAQTFMRPPAEIMKDRISDSGSAAATPFTPITLNRTLDSLDNDAQRQEALKDAVARGRIDIGTATRIAQQRGYVQASDATPASRFAPGGGFYLPPPGQGGRP